MFPTMKYLLFVVIFLTLAMHAAESAKRSKRSLTYQKDKQHQEKIGRVTPRDVKVEAKVQGGKKHWKELQLDEKKILKKVEESKWREQMQPDMKGKQQYGKSRLEHAHSSVMDPRKNNAKPKKLEEQKYESSEQYAEGRVTVEDKPKQNKSSLQVKDSSIREDDDAEEEMESTSDSVEECVGSMSRAKITQNSATKTKESMLIQEDIDGKCYYEL